MRRTTHRLAALSVLASAIVAACGWDPARPFEREAPKVNEAIAYYDGGEADSAAAVLSDYLLTGACAEGNIGTPNRLNERPSATFDLGLALFRIGEGYGQRFGDEEADAGGDPNLKGLRAAMVECALRILRRVSEDASQPVSLRARARYLEGNLLFLTAAYEEAVVAYDKSLELAPGMDDAGPTGLPDASRATFSPDAVGRDAAWNRAIALRRIEDKKDAGSDSGGDASEGDADGGRNDAGGDDEQNDGGSDSGGNGDNEDDAGKDSGGDDDKDAGANPPPKPDPEKDEPDAGAPPPPSRQSQDERILDQLENAPTVQQEAARKQAGRRKMVHGMVDK